MKKKIYEESEAEKIGDIDKHGVSFLGKEMNDKVNGKPMTMEGMADLHLMLARERIKRLVKKGIIKQKTVVTGVDKCDIYY